MLRVLMDILKEETQLGVLKCKLSGGLLLSSLLISTRAAEIQKAYAECPNTKLIASGYSQGCQLVHNAAAQLPVAVAQWISSAVIFGDPGTTTKLLGLRIY
jgi:predicted esterase